MILDIACVLAVWVAVFSLYAIFDMIAGREQNVFALLGVLVILVIIEIGLACVYSAVSYPTTPRTETVTVEKVGEDGKVVVVHDTRYVPMYSYYHPWFWCYGPYGYYGPYVVYHDHYHYGSSGIYRNVPANKTVVVNKTVNVTHNHAAPAPHANAPVAKPATPNVKPTAVKPVSVPKFNSPKPSGGGFKPSGGGFRSRGRR